MNVANLPRLTSESRVLRGGQIGGWVDGRSPEGRFLAKVERSLVAELGGSTYVCAETADQARRKGDASP